MFNTYYINYNKVFEIRMIIDNTLKTTRNTEDIKHNKIEQENKQELSGIIKIPKFSISTGTDRIERIKNSETLKMIEWLNNNSNVEIGLATNGSFVTEEIARKLGETRVMVTLHFPGVGENDYFRVTKCDWKSFENCVNLFDKYNIDYSFNYTLYPDTIDAVDNVIEYSINKGKRVKLLPFLDNKFSNSSEKYLEKIFQKLNSLDSKLEYYSKKGFYLWSFNNKGAVKIIESPCYKKNIELCKEYGEIRLLPDLSLMNCIFAKPVQTKNLSEVEILNLFYSLLSDMSSCSKVISV